MNVKDIVRAYLKDNGYDGLCGDFCGCGIDDLMCGCDPNFCEPAYFRECKFCSIKNCEMKKELECDSCYHPKKLKFETMVLIDNKRYKNVAEAFEAAKEIKGAVIKIVSPPEPKIFKK